MPQSSLNLGELDLRYKVRVVRRSPDLAIDEKYIDYEHMREALDFAKSEIKKDLVEYIVVMEIKPHQVKIIWTATGYAIGDFVQA
tara:strand:- start:178 stop:432 length:255 start_codon:yes stop_codon:yes gene_type:complete